MHERTGKTMQIEHTKIDELNALMLAERAAWDAYNDARTSCMSAETACEEAFWERRSGAVEEAREKLTSARDAADEKLRAFLSARDAADEKLRASRAVRFARLFSAASVIAP